MVVAIDRLESLLTATENMPMKEVRGSILHSFTLMVREALEVDQCILSNSCWLCKGWETTRLLPFGWHREYSATRTQLCTSVLSRISGMQ